MVHSVKVKVLVASLLVLSLAATYVYFAYLAPRQLVLPPPSNQVVELPPPRLDGPMSLEEAIANRRSIRRYTDEPLTLQDLSQLLWAAQGITDPERGFRAAPSAGATYPLELYVVVGAGGVVGLPAGIYHYDPHEHAISLWLEGDLRDQLCEAALGQEWVREAPISIVIAAAFERTTSRYGERGIRYVYLEAGHAAENVYLQAVALGLGTVAVGAFYDSMVEEVLALPEDQDPIYIMPVGHPA